MANGASVAAAIETRELTRHFDEVTAVEGLSLTVPRGTFFGFLGPNGAGKSTTLKMLTGLLAPSSGGIRILGMDPGDPAQGLSIKRKVGVVPEESALFDNLTAREYLTFVGRMHRLSPDVVSERCVDLLSVMNLDGEGRKLCLEYSHGMKKKLAMAAALLPGPEVLFLDEPFEGVDAVASRVLRDALKRCVENGATVFLTSHVLEIVEKLCTDVAIIAKGRLVCQESMQAFTSGTSLEERFLDVVGRQQEGERHLNWLEGDA
jgi:ABC-2 type transport system ATP-binding protein